MTSCGERTLRRATTIPPLGELGFVLRPKTFAVIGSLPLSRFAQLKLRVSGDAVKALVNTR